LVGDGCIFGGGGVHGDGDGDGEEVRGVTVGDVVRRGARGGCGQRGREEDGGHRRERGAVGDGARGHGRGTAERERRRGREREHERRGRDHHGAGRRLDGEDTRSRRTRQHSDPAYLGSRERGGEAGHGGGGGGGRWWWSAPSGGGNGAGEQEQAK